MGHRPHRIKATNLPTLDVRSIHDAVRGLGFKRQDERTASFLSTLLVEGRTLQFVINKQGFDKLRVLCPSCDERKQVLLVLEGETWCRRCHMLREPSRCAPPVALLARYFRPWILLAVYETKLRACVTDRQRTIVRNKVRKLRAAMPEYIIELYDEGAAPLDLIAPSYFVELARAL